MSELQPPQAQTPSSGLGSGFAPFRHVAFAVIWCATVLANMGHFMRDVASGWMIAELSDSPTTVAMVQAAGSLPFFLFAIVAGVLIDVLDRRKYMIAVQAVLAGVTAALAALGAAHAITVPNLLGLCFLAGCCTALLAPAWQAIVPDLVPRAQLRNAITLNSLGVNIARATGPALGGVLLAGFGATAVFASAAVAYLLVVAALAWWRTEPRARDELDENFAGAVRAGLRYVSASPDMHRVLARVVVFIAFANLMWALLPLIARDVLRGGPAFYGNMLASIGVGAIAGAMVLPRMRLRMTIDQIVLLACLQIALVLVVLSFQPPRAAGLVLGFAYGAAWLWVMTNFGSMVQSILPNWVRGRGLAIYLMTYNGSMALASLAWGGVAEHTGVAMALLYGGIGMGVAALFVFPFRFPSGDADLSPAEHWPEPGTIPPEENDRGPVLVTISYEIDPGDRERFLTLLRQFKRSRQRDGAYSWGVAEDSQDPRRIVEWFLVDSWAEHLRQHRRVSKADADVEREVEAFHRGAEPPKVEHFVGM